MLLLPAAGLAQSAEEPAAGTTDETAVEAPAEALWLETLITETPQQGFDLAVTLARRAVKTTQPDVEVLKAQRPIYSVDAGSLIDVSGVAAAWFATVAAANEYWRQ